MSQLVLSCRTVWVRCVTGDLARRYGISDKNPAGDYWKKIPGNANWFTGETGFILGRLGLGCCGEVCFRCVSCLSVSSVTPEDKLWAVTLIGGLSRRLTKLLPHTPIRPPPSGPTLSGDDEDEWELI